MADIRYENFNFVRGAFLETYLLASFPRKLRAGYNLLELSQKIRLLGGI